MPKLSKKKKEEILKKRFPEFFKLLKEFDLVLSVLSDEISEKLNKIEDLEYDLEEIENKKMELNL